MKNDLFNKDQIANLMNRRSFVTGSSVGLGAAALSTLLDPSLLHGQKKGKGGFVANTPGTAGFPEPAPESQTRHLPVHGWRPIASRDLRLQTRA